MFLFYKKQKPFFQDNVILPRLNQSDPDIDPTFRIIEDYARDGLRTLVLASKKIDEHIYQVNFNDK
jgi:hypothetical protein